jgi:3-oxoacyl-(acyl-carrier-protein) synthase
LENAETAFQRGAKMYGEVAGWAQMSDGHHRASPHPEGRGLEAAMKRLLDNSGIRPEDIDYICAHATSTPAGDKAEATAIGSVFRDCLNKTQVSSAKGLTGHSLSMAGVLELALSCLMIKEGFVVGNANLKNVDPDCAKLNLPVETKNNTLSWVLNNSSGFGGINVCHLLKPFPFD